MHTYGFGGGSRSGMDIANEDAKIHIDHGGATKMMPKMIPVAMWNHMFDTFAQEELASAGISLRRVEQYLFWLKSYDCRCKPRPLIGLRSFIKFTAEEEMHRQYKKDEEDTRMQ